MFADAFEERKKQILARIVSESEDGANRAVPELDGYGTAKASTVRLDRSLKGSIDAPIASLIQLINEQNDLVSTSCCSGRVAVFLADISGKKSCGYLLYANHDRVVPGSQTHATDDGDACAADSAASCPLRDKRNSIMSQHVILGEALIQEIEKQWAIKGQQTVYRKDEKKTYRTTHEEGELWLNVEPFVVHLECAHLNAAGRVNKFARDAGLKNFGLMNLPPRRLIYAFRGAHSLRVPLGVVQDGRLHFYLDARSIGVMLEAGNKKLQTNWLQISKAETSFKNVFKPDTQLSKTFTSYATAPTSCRECSPAKVNGAPLREAHPSESNVWVPVLTANDVKPIKVQLESMGLFDKKRKIIKRSTKQSSLSSQCPDAFALIPVLRKIQAQDILDSVCFVDPDKGCLTLVPEERLAEPLSVIADCVSDLTRSPILSSSLTEAQESEREHSQTPVVAVSFQLPERASIHATPKTMLTQLVQEYTTTHPEEGASLTIPRHWERVGDVILFPPNTLENITDLAFWKKVVEVMRCRAVGFQGRITGEKRESQSYIVFGGSGLVRHKENGVTYIFDVTKCMFSSGNGTERKRFATLICRDIEERLSSAHNKRGCQNLLVDMYCGIGYFVLSALKACPEIQQAWACDWNETALRFLKVGADANLGSKDERLRVLTGDSRMLGCKHGPDGGQLRGKATWISLGLIPSSEAGWEAAVRLADETGVLLCVHGLAAKGSQGREEFSRHVTASFSRLFQEQRGQSWSVVVRHVEKVKSYSPKHNHVVADVICHLHSG